VAIPLGTGEIKPAGYAPGRGGGSDRGDRPGTCRQGNVRLRHRGRTPTGLPHSRMVLDVECGESQPCRTPPSRALGAQLGPRFGSNWRPDRLAVSLAGTVVVLEADGSEMWRSPSHEHGPLVEAADSSFVVMGPDGSTLTVPEPKR